MNFFFCAKNVVDTLNVKPLISFIMKKENSKKLSLKKIKLNEMTLNEQENLQGGFITSLFACVPTVQSRQYCLTGNPGTQDSCGLCTTQHYCN